MIYGDEELTNLAGDICKDMTDDERLQAGCFRAIMIFIFVCITVAVCSIFTGCKSVEYVPVPQVHTDTLIITQQQRDSIYMHDSIFVKQKGDTISIERWHTKYVEKQVHDTTYICKIDSVPKPYPVPVTEYVEKELTWWQQLRMYLGGIMIFLAVILAFIKWGIPLIKRLL